ncbi:MAG TPA: 3-oxoacyl-[acyl-carrier-protein] synthase III C-terminal domain-containing protein [Pseudonocardiaceae bacterium]|nr:3-oxoacyl-[acyl-carrier-protein] synthase III C-terminal domain-containing protein [Pseudonocardiaceae bacterium]
MTALAGVSAYLPEHRVPITELAGPLALSASQLQVLQRKHGMREVRRRAPGETGTDLLVSAVRALAELPGREHLVRYVIYARGVPVNVPFPVNPVYELCERVGLGHAVAFTVTHHACATSLLAIDLAGRLLTAEDPNALAVVVAGETVFTHDVELPAEARIFGEGAGACLVTADGHGDRVLAYVAEQRGDLDHWAPGETDHTGRFAKAYRGTLCGVISAAVDAAGLRLSDITLLLPHNVNVVSWERVCAQLGFSVDRVLLENVALLGHTFAADLFVNYRLAAERGLLHEGTIYLAAAAGYGATFAAMIFQH